MSQRVFSGQIQALALSPPGDRLALVGYQQGRIQLWSLPQERVTLEIETGCQRVNGLAFADGGRSLWSSSWDHVLCHFDAETGRELARVRPGEPSYVGLHSVCVLDDGAEVLAGAPQGVVFRFRGDAPERYEALQTGSEFVERISASPDGRLVALGVGCEAFDDRNGCAKNDHPLLLWDRQKGLRLRRLGGGRFAVNELAFSPDGRWLAECGFADAVTLWDLSRPGKSVALRAKRRCYEAAAFTPEGDRAVACSIWEPGDDGPKATIDVYDVASRELLHTWFGGEEPGYEKVVIGTDGRHGYAGARGAFVRVFDLSNGETWILGERARDPGYR